MVKLYQRGTCMKIIPFFARGWESNSYLIVSDGHAALIDAGVDKKTLSDALESENAKLEYILMTHGHFDHTVTADKLRELTGARLFIHRDDAEMLTDATKSALALFFGRNDTVVPCDKELEDREVIALGKLQIKVLHTPGHSKGSVCYLADSALFTGDTLFDGNFGRYDLYGGDGKTLYQSLKNLRGLDGSLDIFPGHGGAAKLGNALDSINI